MLTDIENVLTKFSAQLKTLFNTLKGEKVVIDSKKWGKKWNFLKLTSIFPWVWVQYKMGMK